MSKKLLRCPKSQGVRNSSQGLKNLPKESQEVYISPMDSLVLNFPKSNSVTIALPIPKGETPYALAKQFEYRNQDLNLAEYYYKLAIKQNNRIKSAVKDLASLLHQQGKTKDACMLLEQYKYLYENRKKTYSNLYNTLKKQENASGHNNKVLKISSFKEEITSESVSELFLNSSRIKKISIQSEPCINGKLSYSCILRFNSHSSARKTLESFKFWGRYKVEWCSMIGTVLGDAHYARHKMEEYRKFHPTFDYILFDRDPQGYVLSLPLESSNIIKSSIVEPSSSAKKLLGLHLYEMIFKDNLNLI